jgi:hypothetical protein
VLTTLPTTDDAGIAPKERESHAWEGLSPMTKYSPAGTVIGGIGSVVDLTRPTLEEFQWSL